MNKNESSKVQYAVRGDFGFCRYFPMDGLESGRLDLRDMEPLTNATLFDSVSDAAFFIARRAATSQTPVRDFKIVPVYTETVTTLKVGEPI